MRAKDVLLEALASFSGTVIFVSHDRYFLDRLATRVLEMKDGTVTSHEGNYKDYQRWKDAQAAGVAEPKSSAKVKSQDPAASSASGSASAPSATEDAAPDATKDRPRRLNPIKQKQMEERCASLEQEEIPRIEAALKFTEQQLGVYVSAEETQRLTALAADLHAQLAAFTAEWEDLMMQLEEQASLS